ncbi:MAG: hypothetical protein KAS12_05470, partial [Candidatus Aenigmarchaeota archaeon]|nr:hypothetical protein [Candidatus Aenigmarchaeota archaeon]
IIGTNTTNTTGYVEYNLLPDATYSTEKQKWLGFVPTSDTCYAYNNSDSFNITTWTNVPQLKDELVDIASEGWGIRRTFNVSIYDQNSTATVYLWRASSLSGPWTQMNSSSYTDINQWQNFSFAQTFDCSLQNTWFWKFNVTNDMGNYNSTQEIASNNFTLTQDTILLEEVYGTDSIANRSGSQNDLFYLRVRDLNGTTLSGLMVNFTMTLSPGVWGPVYGNTTNSSGYSVYNLDPGCSPKYEVGDRLWKAYVAEETSTCYAFNTTSNLNFTVMGDIVLDIQKPDGTLNYTQEDTIPFLGSTTDDCGDPLTTTTRFYANYSAAAGYNCTDVSSVGANAYTCDLPTTLQTNMGWYNTTMYSNKSYHYDNNTLKSGASFGRDSLFYLFEKLKLETPAENPAQNGWGYNDWNFSIVASSGHPTNVYDVSVLLSQTPPPTTTCVGADCMNQTITTCVNCIDSQKYWYRNFSYNEIGTWYYRFDMNGTYSDFDASSHKFTVTKDNVSIDYIAGNESSTSYSPAISSNLVVGVNDSIQQKYVSTPASSITFEVTRDAANTIWQTIGTNTTNTTG